MDNRKIKIVSNSNSDELYLKSKSFYDSLDIEYDMVCGKGGKYGLGLLIEVIENTTRFDCDYVIYVDEDCFITDTNKMLNMLDYMDDNDYTICGMPDGGVISHRFHNPISINMFFTIINVKKIREKYRRGVLNGCHYNKSLDKHIPHHLLKEIPEYVDKYDTLIEKTYTPFGIIYDNFEPYYIFFFWALRNGFKILYLNADDANDIDPSFDIYTTVLYDHENKPFCYHSWFARSYTNPTHYVRINTLVDKCRLLCPQEKQYSVIITHRNCNDEFRENNLKKVLDMFDAVDKKYRDIIEIIVVEQDSEERLDLTNYDCEHIFAYNPSTFHKTWGFNIGVSQSSAETLIFADSDVILNIPNLENFFDIAHRENTVSPYNLCKYIEEEKTLTITHGNVDELTPNDFYGDTNISTGGMFSLKRKIFDTILGWDERFVGWGGEDDAMRSSITAHGYKIRILQRNSYHLFHPNNPNTAYKLSRGDNITLLGEYSNGVINKSKVYGDICRHKK